MKKQITRTWVIWSILLTSPSSLAQNTNLDLIIKAGQSASFPGVLVPEGHYRQYIKDHLEIPVYQQQMIDLQKELDSIHEPNLPILPVFLTGVIIGILGVFSWQALIKQ